MIRRLRPFISVYKNRKFRSLHAARWAVIFDTIGVKWIYQREGFVLPPHRFDKQHFLKEHSKEEDKKIGLNKKISKVADYIEEKSKLTSEFYPDFWFPDFNAYGKVKKSYLFKDVFIQDYEKMLRFINKYEKPIFLCSDFNMDVKLISSTGVFGYIRSKDVLFTRNKDEWKKAVKAAIEYRFGSYELPKYKVK